MKLYYSLEDQSIIYKPVITPGSEEDGATPKEELSPNTGESTNTSAYISALLVALVGITFVVKRKKEEEDRV